MFWSMGLLSCVIACVCGLLELLFFLLRVLVLSFIVILLLLPVLVLLYLLYKLVVFVIRADADLTLLFKTLKPHYFDNKVVWVTGASSGIGEELCYQLSRLGARIILSARSEDKLKVVREGLEKPNQAKILPVDLSDPSATREATEKAKALFGGIDILINNAGVSARSNFIDMQEPTHRHIMEVDLFAPWILTHDVLPGMLSSGFGHVINILSIAGKFGTNSRTSYTTAKFGLMGMMDSLRWEVMDRNVHITNVCPGPVRTCMAENALLSDGSTSKKKNPLIEGGMRVQRCVELTLIAASNQLNEVWISKQPYLLLPYLAQYAPSLCKYLLRQPPTSARERPERELKYQLPDIVVV
ncbi:dehydrogenase/reductase SDR family member 7-like [Halichondria panicea]|uniref:dehydrogenase/reductase SDR family member 7-like n=1 Tax=Halichondria panicea TaxID=6063 RepID=UPI00312B8D32